MSVAGVEPCHLRSAATCEGPTAPYAPIRNQNCDWRFRLLLMYADAMRIAVLADFHGNLAALEAVVEDLQNRRPDQVVNLGDCVSGPLWPSETAALLMALGWPTVRGNHDRWV